MPEMNEKWVRDTGLIFSLVFLFFGYTRYHPLLLVSGAILLALLFFPSIVWPLGYFWFNVAEIVGNVMNKVFFGLVFFVIVTPIGYLRRFLIGDARDLSFHTDRASAFVDRSGWIRREQIEKPY